MKFNVLYVDPPYQYENKRTGGSLKSGAVQQYETLSMDELKFLWAWVEPICEDDAVLFLWATVPLLPDAIELMKCWGFEYKTMITWDKFRLGLGYWFRGQTEHLLVGIKGNVKPFRCQTPNIWKCSPEKHSVKPEYFRELIEHATATIENRKMVEIFARKTSKGWFTIGYDVDKMDIKESTSKLDELDPLTVIFSDAGMCLDLNAYTH